MLFERLAFSTAAQVPDIGKTLRSCDDR